MALAEPLDAEDCVIQTLPEVSPTKWHLAHVTWFFERFCLSEYLPRYEAFDERFHFLFNSYYYTVGQMHARARRGLLNRPLLREVLEYRAHVDAAMLDLIDSRDGDDELGFRVTLGIHHEQQHQELLLTDIKHVFFTNPLAPSYRPAEETKAADAVPFEFVEFAGGLREIGATGEEGFCFDNETPRHEVLVGDYALGNRLVTNADFRAFIDDGGYRSPALWMSDGWALVGAGELTRPLYWSEDMLCEFTLAGWQPLDPEAPVCHVSQYEADAFARWYGARLPREAEWELAAADGPVTGNLLDRGSLHPVRAAESEPAGNRVRQLWGDVWEWTASPYVAYPRFLPLAGSLGEYNGKFMANQIVVRGGSCATWASHLRATYRSFFYPRNRWQFLGFRLAKDL
jgi:ergothioneine biosynthesis protein EgtB